MWVKFHDELRRGAKRGIPRAIRFVYLELSLEARAERGTIRLPVGMTALEGVHDVLGGNREEVEAALDLLTSGPDPMVIVRGKPGALLLVVTKWAAWNRIDESAERAKKYRENKAKGAQASRTQNASVTRDGPVTSRVTNASVTRLDQSREDQIREETNVGEGAGAPPGGEPPDPPGGPPGEERDPDPGTGEQSQTVLTLDGTPGGAEVAPRRDIPAEVYAAYLDGWTRYVGKGAPPTLDSKRRKLILARLKDFTAEQLCQAARGAWASEWHREEHGKRMRLDQVYANTGRVEQFIAAATPAPIRTSDNGGYGRVIDLPAPARYVPKVEPMTPKFPNLFGLPGTSPPVPRAQRQGGTS